MPEPTVLRFFLGANSAQGFVSRFDQLGDPQEGWRCTIIKGGPGTGKSSSMKRLAAAMADKCHYIEEIYCSSDLGSLDGVIFPDHKLSVADGTPPHTLEPTFPGAYETIHSLCDCWDNRQLYDNRKAVMGLVAQCSKLHKSASSYLYAAGSLLGQLQQMADEQTDHAKVLRLAASMAARELHLTGHTGSEKIRFVSGITNQGPYCFEETIAALCPRRIALDDSWGSASSLLLSTLRQLALENGHHIITCACPLFPFTKIDHLLLPELGLAFVTQNKLHPLTLSVERTIHARRFLNLERLRQKKHRMAFLQRAAFNMLEQAGNLIGEAKETHDLLEMYYITAMDFQKVNAKSDELVARFREMAQE